MIKLKKRDLQDWAGGRSHYYSTGVVVEKDWLIAAAEELLKLREDNKQLNDECDRLSNLLTKFTNEDLF